MFRIGLRLGCPKMSSWAVTFQCPRNKKRALVFDGSNFPNKFSPKKKKKSKKQKTAVYTGLFFLRSRGQFFFLMMCLKNQFTLMVIITINFNLEA